jgi:hypothetical protein
VIVPLPDKFNTPLHAAASAAGTSANTNGSRNIAEECENPQACEKALVCQTLTGPGNRSEVRTVDDVV